MLIILTFGLVIASILVLCVKKSNESRKLFGLCLSLMMEICGVMIFIAKKGGISQEVLQFLYFSKTIQTKIQYFLITLNQLGYLIALGRTLFPCFLITLAMNYSMIPILRKIYGFKELFMSCRGSLWFYIIHHFIGWCWLRGCNLSL